MASHLPLGFQHRLPEILPVASYSDRFLLNFKDASYLLALQRDSLRFQRQFPPAPFCNPPTTSHLLTELLCLLRYDSPIWDILAMISLRYFVKCVFVCEWVRERVRVCVCVCVFVSVWVCECVRIPRNAFRPYGAVVRKDSSWWSCDILGILSGTLRGISRFSERDSWGVRDSWRGRGRGGGIWGWGLDSCDIYLDWWAKGRSQGSFASPFSKNNNNAKRKKERKKERKKNRKKEKEREREREGGQNPTKKKAKRNWKTRTRTRRKMEEKKQKAALKEQQEKIKSHSLLMPIEKLFIIRPQLSFKLSGNFSVLLVFRFTHLFIRCQWTLQ